MTPPALAIQDLDRNELIALLHQRNQQHEVLAHQHEEAVQKHHQEVQGLHHQLRWLNEQLEWLKRQLFGKKSERFVPDSGEQLPLPGMEAGAPTDEEPASITIQAHTRKKHRCTGVDAMSWPENTPVRETILDLPEDQKVCPETGKPLSLMGQESVDRLGCTPASFFVQRTTRLKYGLPEGDGVRMAEAPERLLSRCKADESLLAQLIVQKYGDHLPVYRIAEILGRDGIAVSAQTLGNWIQRAGSALAPLHDALVKEIMSQTHLYMDETTIEELAPGTGKTKQSYLWARSAEIADLGVLTAFRYADGRRHQIAEEMLHGYGGAVHSDKYGAYQKLAEQKAFTWCPCWAHVRRKFVEAEGGDPPLREEILKMIGQLYDLERRGWESSPDERLRLRQEEAIPIIDSLLAKVKARLETGSLLPKSKFREALGYTLSLAGYLRNYCRSHEGRIDNNVVERAIRPVAIGRNNWLFVGGSSAGQVAAILLSLVQSCRSCGVNPREYLEDVMRRLLDHPAKALRDLLPHRWVKR